MISISNSTLPVYNIHNWGYCGWQFMMAIAFVYPKTPTAANKSDMRSFLHSTGKVLPCHTCRYHFLRAVDSMNSNVLDSPKNLLRWMNMIQNDIRKRQNRKSVPYETMYNECAKGFIGIVGITWKQVAVVFIVMFIVLLVIYVKT